MFSDFIPDDEGWAELGLVNPFPQREAYWCLCTWQLQHDSAGMLRDRQHPGIIQKNINTGVRPAKIDTANTQGLFHPRRIRSRL